ncbi:hypothetical protein [Streptomyces sp. Wh19]|uniref:Chitinase n=1 Tax=Streptomyces sanglieri TaxID=193460 RepID=A0ABW2XBN0_9ACTN|nr:hypothetical protein [Streptomyces sp. Wh19]MDV9194211.1 hypothetical protein [Streptomyces sp. Wh19]
MAAAALVVIALGLLPAFGNHTSCDGPCPPESTGPDGSRANDQFYFLHRDLRENGTAPGGPQALQVRDCRPRRPW